MRLDKGETPWFPTVYVHPIRAGWGANVPTVDAFLQAAWDDLGQWESGVRLCWGDPPERPWVEFAHAFVGYDLTWRPLKPGGIACSMLNKPLTVGTEMVARGVHLDLRYSPTPGLAALSLAHEVRHLCGMPADPHPPPGHWTPDMTRAGAKRWYSWCGPDWALHRELEARAA